MKTYPCFGLEFLGQCNYDPTDPIVYFSIGQLIPLFIIAIAVYQITDPIIKLRLRSNRLFRLKIHFHGLRNQIDKAQLPDSFQPLASFIKNCIPSIELKPFYYFAFLSIFSVFFSNIIPSIPNFYKIPVFGYPIFWEILSGFILTSLGICFIKNHNQISSIKQTQLRRIF